MNSNTIKLVNVIVNDEEEIMNLVTCDVDLLFNEGEPFIDELFIDLASFDILLLVAIQMKIN